LGSTVTDITGQIDRIPLFPYLTHLALARPQNALALTPDLSGVAYPESVDADLPSNVDVSSVTIPPSTVPEAILPSSAFDPAHEEDLVRSWSHPLKTHFPALEILEAWGDWTGADNESLNYFLPIEEVLATTWEFLSGAEQDLWHDEDIDIDGDETIWADYDQYGYYEDPDRPIMSESSSDSQGTLQGVIQEGKGKSILDPLEKSESKETEGESVPRIPVHEMKGLQVGS
jgi:hypothetical protein